MRTKNRKRFERRPRARRTVARTTTHLVNHHHRRVRGRPFVQIPVAVLRIAQRLQRRRRLGLRSIVAELARTGNGRWPRMTLKRRLQDLARTTKLGSTSTPARRPRRRPGGPQ